MREKIRTAVWENRIAAAKETQRLHSLFVKEKYAIMKHSMRKLNSKERMQ